MKIKPERLEREIKQINSEKHKEQDKEGTEVEKWGKDVQKKSENYEDKKRKHKRKAVRERGEMSSLIHNISSEAANRPGSVSLFSYCSS